MKSKKSPSKKSAPPSTADLAPVAMISGYRFTASGLPAPAAVVVHRGDKGDLVSITVGNQTVYLSRARARSLSSAIYNGSLRWGG